MSTTSVDPVEAFNHTLFDLMRRFRSSIESGVLPERLVQEVACMPAQELRHRCLVGMDWMHHFSRCLDDIPGIQGLQGCAVKSCWDAEHVRRVVTTLLESCDDGKTARRMQEQDHRIFELRLALERLSSAVSACDLIKGESATMDVEKANLKARKALGLTEQSDKATP